jgi:hypothetical protein
MPILRLAELRNPVLPALSKRRLAAIASGQFPAGYALLAAASAVAGASVCCARATRSYAAVAPLVSANESHRLIGNSGGDGTPPHH